MNSFRPAGVVLTALLAGSLLAVAAPSASAAQSSFATTCNSPVGAVKGTTVVDVSSNDASPKVGDTVTLTWKFVQAASQNPNIVDLQANTVQPTGHVSLGGAQTGTVALTGPRQNPPIPKNSPMVLSNMTGTVKLTAAGDVTITPADYNINVSTFNANTPCKPDATAPVALTLHVAGSGGGTTGGGTSGGTASGGTTSGGTTGGSGGGSGSFPGTGVQVDYNCQTPIGAKSASPTITINAKEQSGKYTLTETFASGVSSSPVQLAAGSMVPSTTVKMTGADSGELTLTGPANSAPIPANTPIKPSDMSGSYVPAHTGEVAFTPDVLTIKALGTTTTCTPSNKPNASLKLQVTAGGGTGGVTGSTSTGGNTGGGSTTTGGSSSGSSSGGTSGGLANTGGNDDSFRALGLIGGTVLLLGAAVFVFTPWRRLRKER
ncbi:hypothetical protein DN069_01140 [Streptacidiphilus pinicola]|uniref:LPXTG cell wall anchor domain-containing protein n=1 Tax=Streptacidiphilus pinicola TaxID=2219663 RepID=A0A2X0KKI5_9ACTN|nr:hypothetical protein [Streptacidiphilus pinicola]RAG87469.1 hypothetical protein DN069_01140 [Streptacidiphilus pinicola]